MRQRTVFFLFASLLAFFVVVQLPLWFLVASHHGRAFDEKAELEDRSPGDEPLDGPPLQQRNHANMPHPTSVVAPSRTSSAKMGVTLHPSQRDDIASADRFKHCRSPTAHRVAIILYSLDVNEVATFPWHLLQMLSTAAARTNVHRCVDIIMITSITEAIWNIVVGDPEFLDLLTSVGFDPFTLSTVQCDGCTSIQLHVAHSRGPDGLTMRPTEARRNAWQLLPTAVGAIATLWGPGDGSRSLVYLSPTVDVVLVPWLMLLDHHPSRGLEAFTVVSSKANTVLSSGVLSSVSTDDEVVLAFDFAGHNAKDARAHVHGRSLFGVSPDAFLGDVDIIRSLWPHPEPLPLPWTQGESAVSTLFCFPEQRSFVQFMLACAEIDVPVVSSGIALTLNDHKQCFSDAPSSDGGVSLTWLFELSTTPLTSLPVRLSAAHLHRRNADSLMLEWETFCIPCFGFTNEVMQFLVPLETRLHLQALNDPSCFCKGTPRAFQESLARLASNKPFRDAWHAARRGELGSDVTNTTSSRPLLIHISHKDPGSFPTFSKSQRPDIVIGRAMYEFTKTPLQWVSHKDQVDEIWVPCRFVKWVFEHAGFASDRLVIIPEPIDVFQYDPAAVEALALPPIQRRWNQASNFEIPDEAISHRITFLTVFKLEDRKGWQELLVAYARAFAVGQQVSLYLVTYIYGEPRNAKHVLQKIKDFVESTEGLSWPRLPHIHVIAEELSELEMIEMYRSVDAFVLPTKGEGWGLPAIQAMSMALPTVVSNWSGVVDFATSENSFLIPVHADEVPRGSPYGYASGKLWGVPSVDAITDALQSIARHPGAARRRGIRARRDIVAQFSNDAIAELVVRRVTTLAATFRAPHVEKVHDAIEKLLEDRHLIV